MVKSKGNGEIMGAILSKPPGVVLFAVLLVPFSDGIIARRIARESEAFAATPFVGSSGAPATRRPPAR